MHLIKYAAAGAMALAAGAALWSSGVTPSTAADHFDPPTRTDQSVNPNADVAADLADVYLFQDSTTLYVALGFAGPRPTTEAARYDRDVLFRIFLSNAGATTDAEFNIDFRFGQDPANPSASGIRITGIPGTTGAITGPVETTLTQGDVRVYAGLFDDPFNFDAMGLTLTRQSGTLMLSNQRNRFTGMNTPAVMIAIPLSAIRNGTNPISAWASSARIIAA